MFKKFLIVAAINLIRVKLLVRINHAELRSYVEKKLIPIEEVVEKLTDKDPNNSAQMTEVWTKYRSEFETDTIDLAIEIVKRKVKDDAVRTLVIAALESLDD
jgi:hypothetical protein